MRHAAEPSLLDFSSLVNSSSTSSTTIASTPFSATRAEPGDEYANINPWVLGSLFGGNRIQNTGTTDTTDTTDMTTFWARNGEGECTCHAGVPELLASMRSGGSSSSSSNNNSTSSNDQRLPPDAQLAKLKQCIVSSEISMGCAHGREDSEPIHIMAVAMLIGYVIDGFKVLASESSLRRPPPWSSTTVEATTEIATLGNAERGNTSKVATSNSPKASLRGLMEPRLSWGMLALEENDEMDLRQRLYLLSFRKLERLLSQLTLYLRDLHNTSASLPDPSRHMAFVTACDYTRLWLEKKASDVKKMFSVPKRDEMMDPALA
ncbi:MAG: hypothetical protein M1820_007761 [Bogoriella megaspora]|nr:MAG: hypothetical protein M1820_007761 [Bogoriella megaspora]